MDRFSKLMVTHIVSDFLTWLSEERGICLYEPDPYAPGKISPAWLSPGGTGAEILAQYLDTLEERLYQKNDEKGDPL